MLPSTINKVCLSRAGSFFIAFYLLFFSFVAPKITFGQNTVWEKPFAGNDPSLLYYPDQNAVYIRYAWENKNGKGIIIKGKMPDSRYFSFNLYNDHTKSSIASLADYEIKPDEGDIFKHYSNPDDIGAFNFNPGGNYPNKDNFYIVMPVVRSRKDVLVVKFKPPTHSTRLGDTTHDVRYYSISQGNEYTNTSFTMYDEQLRISKDGFIYVVVANDDQVIRTKVNEMGINFMPWLYKDKLVLILRHMLPSPAFKQSTREVPLFDKSRTALGQKAQFSIGEYALTGKFFKISEWKSVSQYTQLGF